MASCLEGVGSSRNLTVRRARPQCYFFGIVARGLEWLTVVVVVAGNVVVVVGSDEEPEGTERVN